jgi:competence protein ComEC
MSRRRFPVYVLVVVLVIFPTLLSGAIVPKQPTGKDSHDLRVTFVNTGAGLCTVINCPVSGGGTPVNSILYDCGSSGVGENGMPKDLAVGYVQHILNPDGIAIFVSHPDGDHYNYIEKIMEKRKAVVVVLGGHRVEYNFGFQRWLKSQEEKGARVLDDFKQGGFSPIGTCGTAPLDILTVNAGEDRNSQSLVLQIKYGEQLATMTGDATIWSLASILHNAGSNPDSLKTTLLSAPHHGATTEGSNNFLWPLVFKPKIVVYSAGDRYFHPRCGAFDKYQDAGSLKTFTSSHAMRCGDEDAYWDFDEYTAQFLTSTNGNIWIDFGSNDNEFRINCDQGCG